MPELKTFTREEVARHSSPNDTWIIIDSEGERRGSVLNTYVLLSQNWSLLKRVHANDL